jgi:magnesium-transporting ATPase (P-type)
MEGRDERMGALMDEIEGGLVLQGSTAIEDKLQDGVADTLSALREGGILVWMLTGDKVDTAINIGFSCSLLTMDMALLRLVADDGEMALDDEKVPFVARDGGDIAVVTTPDADAPRHRFRCRSSTATRRAVTSRRL